MNNDILQEIIKSLSEVDGFGSVEIYVSDFQITQITVRKIKKTAPSLARTSTKYSDKRHQTLDKAISI